MSTTRTPGRPGPQRPARSSADRPSLVGAGSASRFTRRRRAGRLRTVLRAAAVLLLVAAVAVTGWAVYYSGMFAVERVVVVGTHRVTTAQVEQAARVPMGTPIVRLDAAAIRMHVESIPQLASVLVTTQWPHTVTITVVERTPAAVVALAAGGYELVDVDGVDLGHVAARPRLLPLLVLDPTTTAPTTMAAAAQVAASLTRRLAAKVRSITALTANSVVLSLTNGTVVHWGDSSQGAIKAEVLAALMKHHALAYDVSAPYAPTLAGG
jgi:cell division protein FtsQ